MLAGTNNSGNTPIMRCGLNADMIKLLLANGADYTLENNSGVSPIKIYEAYSDILSLLKN